MMTCADDEMMVSILTEVEVQMQVEIGREFEGRKAILVMVREEGEFSSVSGFCECLYFTTEEGLLLSNYAIGLDTRQHIT